tara:strand:+ start:382 stop:744 length:363 start_codon:yes stop_codon:yes gene_type:complete
MIEINTDISHLNSLAADLLADGINETGTDIKLAADDLKYLVQYGRELEGKIQQLAEVAALNNPLIKELELFVNRQIETKVDELSDIREDIREQVRSMINDGEILIKVDYSNVELELSLEI